MQLRVRAPLLLMLLASAVASTAQAQQADLIRGRILAAGGEPIADAVVDITTIPGNVKKSARSDKSGRYTVVFAAGEGDYWVSVAAIGFAPRRFELKRLADEAVLIGDARLQRVGTFLDEVRVQAERARVGRSEGTPDVSGTEKSVGTVGGDPAQAGSLAAMAATAPGIQLIPGVDGAADGFSAFGLGGDQNRTTLNGLGFSGTDIPRDASTRASLSTSPWDVSRGGFSGAQMNLSTQAGSNFSSRGLSTLFSAPAMQFTDAAGRSLGARFGSTSIGAATAGPISTDKAFYSIGYQFDRRTSALPTLASADAAALGLAGVAADSVARFRSIVSEIGAPIGGTRRLPEQRISDRALVLANFDWAPPSSTSGQALTITAAASYLDLNAPVAQITALPTNDLSSNNLLAAVQGRHTVYLDNGVLSETSAGVNQQRMATDPYLAMPSAGVRVQSSLDDRSSAIAGLTFAGSPTQRTRSAITAAAVQNQLSWVSLDNKHRLQLTSTLRYDGFSQDYATNTLGNYLYNSLADLQSGNVALYTRTLGARSRRAAQLIGGLSLGDAFRMRPDFQIQYGVRLDGNRFLDTPGTNDDVRRLFGMRNDALPERLYLSPRIGFAWTYGESPQIALGEGFVRAPRAVVRAGIGVFQNTPNSQLIGNAISNTGLPGTSSQLVCVGTAAPRPDWRGFAAGSSALPTACADGTTGSAFASRAPDVWAFAPGYGAQRSIRSTASWSGVAPGNRVLVSVEAAYSTNLQQSGALNLNFDPRVRFLLPSEGGRPMYADPTSIVPSTGAVGVTDARLAPAYGAVMEQRSDLASFNRQISVSIQPVAFSSSMSWNVGYTYSNTREATRGTTSTAGDPRAVEWSRGALDSRHQVSFGLSYNVLDWVPISLTGSFRSGRPFTPLIGADINGDGFRNDRAFVFDPYQTGSSAAAIDAGTRDGMRALIERGSAEARSCLQKQLGRLAERASCEEPWTSTSTLTVALNSVRFGLPQRLNVSFYINNAFGAADLLLHGERQRRGWGQALNTDQTLLYVRGFDPVARRFQYDVNPRFGATNPNETINRNPVVVTAQFRYDIGFSRERQLLTQSLDRGRARSGARATEPDFRGMSATLVPQNPMAIVLRQSDTLRLTRRQADELSTINRQYAIAYDSIWAPVVRYLVALPEKYDRGDAYARYRSARERTIDQLIALAPRVRALLTPDQLRMLPSAALTSLDTRYLAAVRSSTAGGADLGALGLLAQLGWNGGTVDPSASAVMIHR